MDELEEYVRIILCNDIIGIRIEIYDTLLNEIDYRKNNKKSKAR